MNEGAKQRLHIQLRNGSQAMNGPAALQRHGRAFQRHALGV